MVAGHSQAQVYLKVPFKEKDQAKALGARFDPDAKAWYVPHGVDVGRFVRWLPESLAQFAAPEFSVAPAKKAKPPAAKSSVAKSPAVLTTPLAALRPLLPASSDLNNPPWDV
ncbi:DUF5710 domain-containing protein [Deefgea salmonis]|uniref:DUF5710 domain-containing protein n=1 Tax=Deefgea salmonis TaxID=2875502 RepID=A0ABS8BJL1_9NEIS|nr:DUF5710 domain-containing protein [Deefgea salmonis]MCB5195711.1 DUF5710 domain-containing protein [Deefgea salmonis]